MIPTSPPRNSYPVHISDFVVTHTITNLALFKTYLENKLASGPNKLKPKDRGQNTQCTFILTASCAPRDTKYR